MRMGHTPGLWEYKNATRIYCDGVEIAQVSADRGSLGEMRANANLIAAAPELLETLEKAASWMRFWLDQQECDCPEIYHTCGRYDREKELEEMQAALKKAKGA